MHEEAQKLLAVLKKYNVLQLLRDYHPQVEPLEIAAAIDQLEGVWLELTQQEKIVHRLRKLAVNHLNRHVILWLADEIERYEL